MNVLGETLKPSNKVWPPFRKRGSTASVQLQADLCDSPDTQILLWVLHISHRTSLGIDASLQPGRALSCHTRSLFSPRVLFESCVCFVIGTLVGGRT